MAAGEDNADGPDISIRRFHGCSIDDHDTAQATVEATGDAIVEGEEATVSATGAGFSGEPSAEVNWGDGVVESVSVSVEDDGASSVAATHEYVENDEYEVTVSMTGDDGSTASDTASVEVSNTPPSVDVTGDTIDEGETVTLVSTFEDPGLTDTHTAEVDWGDGTLKPAPVGQRSGGGMIVAAHQYVDDGEYEATVFVTDDDGGTGTATATVTVENVAPTIEATGDTIPEGDTPVISVTINDPGVTDTHTTEIDWGDGAVESTTIDQTYGTTAIEASHQYTDDGEYEATIFVSDNDGGTDTDTAIIDVYNVAPTVEATGDTIAEGETATVTATFEDPGIEDTHTAEIDWQDGTTESVPVDQETGGGSIEATHTYADDGEYETAVSVTDDDDGTGTDTATVVVGNVPPSVEASGDVVDSDGSVAVSATFEDPGTEDTHTAEIDWGNGSVESVPVDQQNRSLEATHTYADDGPYDIVVSVTDDDGDTGTDSISLTDTVADGDVLVFTQDGALSAISADGAAITDLNQETVVTLGSTPVGPGEGDLSGVPFLRDHTELCLLDGPDSDPQIVDIALAPAMTSKTAMAVGDLGAGPCVCYAASTDNGDEIYTVSPGEEPSKLANPNNGVTAISGVGDIDGDGQPELVFADGSQAVRYVDQDDPVTTTFPKAYDGAGSNNNTGIGSPVDLTGDGVASVPIIDGSNQIRLVGPEGLRETVIADDDSEQAAKSSLAPADIDGDGVYELVYLENNNSPAELKYVDDVTGSNEIHVLRDENDDRIPADTWSGVMRLG